MALLFLFLTLCASRLNFLPGPCVIRQPACSVAVWASESCRRSPVLPGDVGRAIFGSQPEVKSCLDCNTWDAAAEEVLEFLPCPLSILFYFEEIWQEPTLEMTISATALSSCTFSLSWCLYNGSDTLTSDSEGHLTRCWTPEKDLENCFRQNSRRNLHPAAMSLLNLQSLGGIASHIQRAHAWLYASQALPMAVKILPLPWRISGDWF